MVNLIEQTAVSGPYDLVVVGSGFGSLFYLHRLLARRPATRVLLLEAGGLLTHAEQIALGANERRRDGTAAETDDHIHRPEGHKPWRFTVGLGGGTLCWWGQTPRLHPNDFSMASLFGTGADWPLTYADLEPFYCDAEDIIGVAGDSQNTGPFWRSRPYPLPAFLPSSADQAIRDRHPDAQIAIPAARQSTPSGERAQCCAFGDCQRCPNDAKFTAFNGLSALLAHPSLSILTQAEVKALDIEGGQLTGVVYRHQGKLHSVRCSHSALGANAVFNPTILHRSGLTHPELGKGICEQVGAQVEARLSTHSGVNGGTSATGMYCADLDGPHRAERGASVIFFDNRWKFQGLRPDFGKYLNTLLLVLNSEDLRQRANFVQIPEDWTLKPTVHHAHHSDYGHRGMTAALATLEELLAPIGLESLSASQPRQTESHLQCTTPMGHDPATSIVDAQLVHHQIRNLHVLGTSTFTTCPVANPSLTAAALSLRAAEAMA